MELLEPIAVAKKMEGCMQALVKLCGELDGVGRAKVETQVKYEVALQIQMVHLKEAGEPASTRKDSAKGLIPTESENMLMAEIKYKALHTKIEAAKSTLNGWQSYNRHLDVVAK